MNYRTFGRLGWQVSEIGYGMWGMGGWSGSDDVQSLAALEKAVQVIYNIFDQNPEDELFPLCRELNIAVIARVPFDEGSLTGTLHEGSRWPEGDWRNRYFTRENLLPTLARVERLRLLVPEGMTLPELALRFILENDAVSTVIPGMRKLEHVMANTAVSDEHKLDPEIIAALKEHRWERRPAPWSD